MDGGLRADSEKRNAAALFVLCAFLGPWLIQCLPGSALNNYDYFIYFSKTLEKLLRSKKLHLNNFLIQ